MELFQVFWDDGKRLFLEFKKDEKEDQFLLPEKIKRLSLKFEISRNIKRPRFTNQPPYLVSIKKLYYSDDFLCFSVDLNEIYGYDDLQIKILRLTVHMHSGQRIEYKFEKKFNISDIWINEDCYVDFQFIDLDLRKTQHSSITREKLYQEVSTDSKNEKTNSKVIYEKNSINSISVDESIVSMISESNKTLKSIEHHLKDLNLTLQNIPIGNMSYNRSLSPRNRNSDDAIERIRVPRKPELIQGQMTSGKLMIIKEMKTIFKQNIEKNEDFNIKDILKPLTEEELKEITVDDAILMKKEKEAIKNQLKRLQKQQEKELCLEDLNKPK